MFWWKRTSFWPDLLVGIFFFYGMLRRIFRGELIWGISPFIWIIVLIIGEILTFIIYKSKKKLQK